MKDLGGFGKFSEIIEVKGTKKAAEDIIRQREYLDGINDVVNGTKGPTMSP